MSHDPEDNSKGKSNDSPLTPAEKNFFKDFVEEPDSEEEHFDQTFKFEEAGLHPLLLQGVGEAGFKQCTPIQAKTLPLSLKRHDILGNAQTGTGKTAAFLLTIYHHLLHASQGAQTTGNRYCPRALILAPTRELVEQIYQDALVLGKFAPIKLFTVIGGVEYEKQKQHFKENPEILIATPGRLMEYIRERYIGLDQVSHFVIDEADRMFDMGFYPDLKFIMRKLPNPEKRQTLLFSATMGYRVTELSYEFMNNPIEVDVAPERTIAQNIEETLYHVGMDEKLSLLLGLLAKSKNEKVLIFSNTKSQVEYLGFKLKGNGYHADILTGDLSQKRRLAIFRQFKEGTCNVLIATDVASRGLHVDDISHVFNYDLPEDAENYVHRIGRTARVGKSGTAISFACEKYVMALPQIEEYIGHKIETSWAEDDDFKADEAPHYRRKPSRLPPRGSSRDGSRSGGGGRRGASSRGTSSSSRRGASSPSRKKPSNAQRKGASSPSRKKVQKKD